MHCMWNDLKNSFKRADCQPALLLGIVMSQMAHGPFLSGANQHTREETAKIIAETISQDDFETLRESMLRDRYGDTNEVPEKPADIPNLSSVETLPIFVPKTKFSWVLGVIGEFLINSDSLPSY